MANKTKLLEVLQRCFPDKCEYMLTIAFYLLDHSSSMMHIDDWAEGIELIAFPVDIHTPPALHTLRVHYARIVTQEGATLDRLNLYR